MVGAQQIVQELKVGGIVGIIIKDSLVRPHFFF